MKDMAGAEIIKNVRVSVMRSDGRAQQGIVTSRPGRDDVVAAVRFDGCSWVEQVLPETILVLGG